MASNPIYRYEVIDRDGSAEFGTDQVKNWAELKPSLKRNATYKGLVPSFTNTFVFVKEIRRRFRNLIDKYGYNTAARFFIYAGNSNGERNSFEQIGEGQEFVANFADKPEIDETTIQVNFEDSSFTNSFFSGHKEKVEFNKTKNLSGGDMSAYELDDIILHDRTIKFVNKLSFDDTILAASGKVSFDPISIYYPIPCKIDYKSDDNYKNIPFVLIEDAADSGLSYYLKSEASRSINQTYNIDFTFNIIQRGNASYEVIKRITDTNDAIVTEEVLQNGDIPNDLSGAVWNFNFTYNETEIIDVEEGYSLQFFVKIFLDGEFSSSAVVNGIFLSEGGVFDISSDSIEYFPQTTAKCIRPHKLFSRLTEFLTGDSDAFYSTVFGTTGDGYDSDGEWARLVALNGFMIRGFDFEEKPFVTSFEEAFKAYNCIEPLALSIETINGKQRVRIEKFNDLFEDGISIKLENINSLKRIIDDDRLYTIVKAGYKDQEYEEVNGLDTAFGELNYSTPLTSKDKTYDIICKWRAGDYDIEFPRRKQFSDSPTEDTRYDKDNYLIDAYLVGEKLVSRKSELFQLIEGVLAPENIYNARLTPKRNTLRHGGIIKESLTRSEDESLINIKGASNQNLVTQLITEASPVVEKDDIPISTLPRPKLLAEKFSLNTALSLTDYNILNLNKNKIVNFTDISGKELSMYVGDLKYDHPKGEVEATGLRANR